MARKEILELEGKVNSKELVKEFEKVKDEVKETNKEVDKLGKDGTKDLEKVENQTKKTSRATRLLGIGVKAVGLALKALGIGLIVTGIAKLTQAFTQNQKVLDGLNNVFETINIVFSQFTTAVINIFNGIQKATNGFEALGKVVKGIITIALTPLKLNFLAVKLAVQQAQLAWEKSFFGDKDQDTINELNKGIAQTRLDVIGVGTDAAKASVDIVTNFSKAIEDIKTAVSITTTELGKVSIDAAKEQAKELVNARNAAQLAAAQQQLLIEKYDQQAEIQRQIRDDDRVGLSDRIKANQALNEVLELQQKAQIEQAELLVRAAQLELNVNNNIENQVALTAALAEKQGVLAAIEGFRSEQKVNEASLERELLELQNSRTEAQANLSFEQQRAAAQEIINKEQSLISLRDIAEDERNFELIRLQEKINNTKTETQSRIDAENEFAQAKFELNEGLKESETSLEEFRQNISKQSIEASRKEAEAKKDLENQVFNAKTGIALNVLQLARETAGEGTKIAKIAAIAQATISGIQGTVNAFQTAAANPITTFFPAYPFIQGGLAAGFSALQIGKIASSGSGGASAPSTGGGASRATAAAQAPQAIAPSFNIVGDSGSNQITDAINTQGNRPTRAYVVTKDIKTQLELDRNTQDNSSLG
jgi:hypothetical protein